MSSKNKHVITEFKNLAFKRVLLKYPCDDNKVVASSPYKYTQAYVAVVYLRESIIQRDYTTHLTFFLVFDWIYTTTKFKFLYILIMKINNLVDRYLNGT